MSLPDAAVWARFSLDPRQPASADMRASDVDRDIAVQALGSAYADGRLTREEYDERAEAATGARTLGMLAPLLEDLLPAAPPSRTDELSRLGPADLQARAERRYEAQRRHAIARMLVPSLVCVVIWIIGGFGPDGWDMSFPWPLFVILGTGLHPLRVVLRHEELVAQERARLEKKQRKALESRRQQRD